MRRVMLVYYIIRDGSLEKESFVGASFCHVKEFFVAGLRQNFCCVSCESKKPLTFVVYHQLLYCVPRRTYYHHLNKMALEGFASACLNKLQSDRNSLSCGMLMFLVSCDILVLKRK